MATEGDTSTTTDDQGTPQTTEEQDQQGAAPTDAGEGAKKALEAERKAAREARAEAKRLAGELETLRSASLSETERTAKERDTYKAKYEDIIGRQRDAAARERLTTLAAKAGAIDAGFVAKALRGDYDSDDDGSDNAQSLIAALKKESPALFRAVEGGANGGEAKGKAVGEDFSSYIRNQLWGR